MNYKNGIEKIQKVSSVTATSFSIENFYINHRRICRQFQSGEYKRKQKVV